MKTKKIIIAGGTGFIGQKITNYFGTDNDIVILTRQVENQKTNAFGENSMLSVAYIGAEHITHADPAPTTDVNDRLDSIFSLSWSWQFRPGFVFQPYYRFQQTHYWANSTRNDLFHTVGATISWVITDWASVRTFASWENRNSNASAGQAPDYQKLDGGLGLSVVLHF